MGCENLNKKYISFIVESQDLCKMKILEFTENGSEDEGILEKIKLNIYDVFKQVFEGTMIRVCGRSIEDNEEKYKQLYDAYIKYFDKIPKSWVDAREKAKSNNDIEKVVIEDIKINTANIIKDNFIRIYKTELW